MYNTIVDTIFPELSLIDCFLSGEYICQKNFLLLLIKTL